MTTEAITTSLVSDDDPTLHAIGDFDSLADYLRRQRAALNRRVQEGAGGLESALAYSDLTDSVVQRLFALACEHAGAAPDTVPIAVVATGGYGRRELCPHSDVDITFIPKRDGEATIDRVIKEMFTAVMRVFIDANGIEVGYAYRLLEDCASLDHQTTSGLLDARVVAGSPRTFLRFEHEFWSYFNPAAFIFAKVEERQRQQQKAGMTARVVEPNLKEGAGGLRDLQSAVWVTQARRSLSAARVRGDRVWEALIQGARVEQADTERLREAREFLFRVRNALHVAAGAARDQLVVTRQEEVAEMLGYAHETDGRSSPTEQFMRDLYGHTTHIHRIAGEVVRRTEQSRLVLGIGLDCKRKQVIPANTALASENPIWMLWACELAQRYELEFSEDLEHMMLHLLETRPVIQDGAQAADIFRRILASPRGVYSTLQRMADLGLLGWLLPEVGETLDLIPYDSSHDYTVGQHTLYVIHNLEALRLSEESEETRDYRQILRELPHPEQLFLAALLHDAGKAETDRPHSEVGEEIAMQVCRRLGWGESDFDNVRFLVRHHLLMAETSRLRDLNLEETIRDFTAVVDDPDRLNMLYLLTYADTSAVGAGVWTQVKGRFLRDLHRRAERMLTGDEDESAPRLVRTRRRLLKELSVENLPPDEVALHIGSMPATYLLNTSREEIVLHVGFVRRARQGTPMIAFHDERDSTFTEVLVCTRDDPAPGLLAKIAGVFYATGLDVHSAQVVTRIDPPIMPEDETIPRSDMTRIQNPERIAIDNFYVDYRGRRLTPGKREEVETALTEVLTGRMMVTDLLARRNRPSEIGGPIDRLNLRNDLSDAYTVIEIVASDEHAMLYRASGALSELGWDIHSARISFFRGRSVAGFYVTGARALGENEARRALLRVMPLSEETKINE